MIETFPVSLIRQYSFCPRIPFFNERRNIHASPTPWAAAGTVSHESEEKLIARRSFEFMGLGKPKIEENVELHSINIGFHGRVDAILIWNECLCILDFKTRFQTDLSWK